MKVLIYGLPGAGKSFLAEKLCEYLGDKVAWINADKVREEANDWDFSDDGRLRQKIRMQRKCEEVEAQGKIALADFVCPFKSARKDFNADYNIFVDTISEGRFEDTNKVFEKDDNYDYRVKNKNDKDAKIIAWSLGNAFMWNDNAPTTQMLGRYQPWHDGHQALLERAMEKHGQVCLMIRNMETDENNPYDAHDIAQDLKFKLVHYAGRLQIRVVPNILNITYGRDVGYKIEQEHFDKSIEDISATKIRNGGKQT